MKTLNQEPTGPVAVERLRKLYNSFKDRPRGAPRLTLKKIMEFTGVKTIATVSLWISKGERHHEPQGAALDNLWELLKKAEDKAWLEKFIAKKGSK